MKKRSWIFMATIALLGMTAQGEYVLFTQQFDGIDDGTSVTNVAVGSAYTTEALNQDRLINSALVTSVGSVFNNFASPATSEAIVSAGHLGIEAAGPYYFEEDYAFGARVAALYSINSATSNAFMVTRVELEVANVSSNGFRAGIGCRLADGTDVDMRFNGGANLTNGTNEVDLSLFELVWTSTNSPLLAGNFFRLCPYDSSLGDADGTIVSMTVYADDPPAEGSEKVLLVQNMNGLASGLVPGDIYTTAAWNADRTANSMVVSSVEGNIVNSSSPATTPSVVAAGNAGLEGASPAYWENGLTYGARIRGELDINNAADAPFMLSRIEVVVSGVTNNGVRAGIGYRLTDNTTITKSFNGGANLTNGTYSIDLSLDKLVWTGTSSPLLNGGHFRILPYDSSAGGGLADGIFEQVTLYVTDPPAEEAPELIFKQNFTGLSSAAVPGSAYTTAMLNADRIADSSIVASLTGNFISQDSAGTSPMLVAPDNAGVTSQAPNYFENAAVYGARSRAEYDIGYAATNTFSLGVAEIVVSGIESNGMNLAVGWRPADLSGDQTVGFNDGIVITNNGTYQIDLTEYGLTFTDSSSPFAAGNNFRLLFGDGLNGMADGVVEKFTVYKVLDRVPPKPATLSIADVAGVLTVTASDMGITATNTLQYSESLVFTNWIGIATTSGVAEASWGVTTPSPAVFYRVESK